MMDFHDNAIHEQFEGTYGRIYSETESLLYCIRPDYIDKWMKQKIILIYQNYLEKIEQQQKSQKFLRNSKTKYIVLPSTDVLD